VVDWYYIFSILELGVYPPPKAIYNVHKFITFSLPARQLITAQTHSQKALWISSVPRTLSEMCREGKKQRFYIMSSKFREP
jgi:hypothetical protein